MGERGDKRKHMKSVSGAIIMLAGAAWYIAAHFAPDNRPQYAPGSWYESDYLRLFSIILAFVGGVLVILGWRSEPKD
jgi:hypothetical protein